MIHFCLECGKLLENTEDRDEYLCAGCNAKLDNDLHLMESDSITVEDFFQVI